VRTKVATWLALIAMIFTIAGLQRANAALSASEKKTINQMQKQIGILSARVGELERQLGTADGTFNVDTVNYLSTSGCGTGLQVNQISGSFSIGNTRFLVCQFLYNYSSR
jgi:hypothetical protein